MSEGDAAGQEVEHLARVLNTAAEPVELRTSAARRLSVRPEPEALEALLVAAQDESAPPAVGRAAGRGVATVLLRLDRIEAADLANFTAEAYLGFDDEAARRMRSER
jgi:hypothetical protein